jgi:hypothetical protein
MREGRRGAAVIVFMLAVAACSTVPTAGEATTPATALPTGGPPAGSPPASGVVAAAVAMPQCRSADLAVSLTPPEGAAGSVYRALVFTNNGHRSCRLQGFPGVSYVGSSDDGQVGPAAQRVGDLGDVVPIAPGGAASAQLQLVNVANYDAGVCRPTPVRGLRVYPPGETTALVVLATGTGCAGTPPGPQLSVRAITALTH